MVHVTDMFTTLLRWAGCDTPADRVIDGIDQRDFFAGSAESSRDGTLVWLNEELHAVKWSQFKISFKRQQHFHDPEIPLGFARITNLLEDPKEREPVNQTFVRWWVMQHARRLMREFEASTEKEGLIPAGAPLDYVPEENPGPDGRHTLRF
jgi:arylsulfatase